MSLSKYLNDFKNLQPRPLDTIPPTSVKLKSYKHTTIPASPAGRHPYLNKAPINNKSERKMERLNTSKTLWGFGIAVFIYIMQSMLVAFNIASPDNLILKTFIEVVIALAGFFGIYGVRDALRKMSL